MDSFLDLLYLEERRHLAVDWTFQSSFYSDLWIGLHLDRGHPTCVSALVLFPEQAQRLQEWQICVVLKNVAWVPRW